MYDLLWLGDVIHNGSRSMKLEHSLGFLTNFMPYGLMQDANPLSTFYNIPPCLRNFNVCCVRRSLHKDLAPG